MTEPTSITFRRPVEDDHPHVVGVVDEWWGGRRMRALLPRLWFQHFTGTSWIAEDDQGRLAGFVVAFISQDDPSTGYIHMVAADPNRRRGGVGRATAHGRRRATDRGGAMQSCGTVFRIGKDICVGLPDSPNRLPRRRRCLSTDGAI